MQATFLILVRRAPSIRDPDQLDRWLAGVARRVAARAHRRELRRIERESHWAQTRSETSVEPEKLLHTELRRVVREELGLLPAADQQPLTLCYIHGLTHEEAARQIGCPIGTIKARLVRARRRLRDRLDRRGVALGLGLLFFLVRRPTLANADGGLVETTAEAMTFTARGDLTEVRSLYPQAFNLTRLVSPLRRFAPRRLMIAALVGLLLLGGGGAVVARLVLDRQEANRVSARLVKLLDMDCQTNP